MTIGPMTIGPTAIGPLGRPFVLLSAAVSLDGYLDDAGPDRLRLSSQEDFDRVDEVRAGVDAILVGAGTVRADDPRLTVRSESRRLQRIARGMPEHPLKVTVTGSGELDAGLRFWRCGGDKLVFTVDAAVAPLRARLDGLATVLGVGATLEWPVILGELAGRGVRRLMVEGGGTVHSQLLAADLADELQLVFAPLIVGQAGAPRFLRPADYPGAPAGRMRLLEVRQVGDVVLVRYSPKDRRAQR